MSSLPKDKLNPVLAWLPLPLGLTLLTYVVWRAMHLSITHDEASTYLSYVPRSIWEIVTYAQPTTANNHILNTLLVKLATRFGDAEWLLRLPNVLAGAGYLLLAWLFSRRLFSRPGEVLLSFVLLTCNAYLLDFFGLARGYGLSLCFLMGSLYFFQRFATEWRLGFWRAALGMAVLAVYSNFTLLNYLACLLVLGLLALWMREGRAAFRSPALRPMLAAEAGAVLLTALLAGPGVYALVTTDELYFAGQHGFFRDTYYSLVRNFLYEAHYLSRYTIDVIFGAVLALQLVWLFFLLKRAAGQRCRLPQSLPVLYALLVFLAAVSLVAQYYLLGTLYVQDRMALYFYPLLAVVSALGLVCWPLPPGIRTRTGVVVVLLMLNHFFVRSGNLDRTYEWAYDRNTRDMMAELDVKGTVGDPVRFGGPGIFQPAMLYYHSTGRFPNIEPIRWDPEVRRDTFFEYYFVFDYQLRYLHPSYELYRVYENRFLMYRPAAGKE